MPRLCIRASKGARQNASTQPLMRGTGQTRHLFLSSHGTKESSSLLLIHEDDGWMIKKMCLLETHLGHGREQGGEEGETPRPRDLG